MSDLDQRLTDALRAFVPEVMRVNHTPGLNMALAHAGGVFFEEGFGLADVESGAPMRPDTVMHSGSMGKTYTATAIMQLVERGLLGLYEPVNDRIEAFKVVNPLGEREVTTYDLLTHRAGMSSNEAAPTFEWPMSLEDHLAESYGKNLHDLYHGTAMAKWTTKVGATFQYSNTGIATLGYLVQVCNDEGLSFSDYVQRYIIEPLGMTSTQYPAVQAEPDVRPELVARFSTGYAGFGGVNLRTPTLYFADFPAGTVVTTPGDHVRLLCAYMGGGDFEGGRILKPETVRHMLSPQITGVRPETDTGLGLVWALGRYGSPDGWFGHSGAHMYGWHNDFRGYPGLDLAVAVATNRWTITDWCFGTRAVHDSAYIAEYAAAFIGRERLGVHPGPGDESWSWKRSYATGLFFADQLLGALSVRGEFTPAMADLMGTASGPDAGELDVDAFRLGVEAIASTDRTVPGITAFMDSAGCRVAPEELPLLHRDITGTGLGTLPVPLTRLGS